MKSFVLFFLKRCAYVFVFVGPVIVGAIGLGILLNILDASQISQNIQNGIATIGMLTLTIFLCIVILARKPLPGMLGSWQKLWNRVPTWQMYSAEYKKNQQAKQ